MGYTKVAQDFARLHNVAQFSDVAQMLHGVAQGWTKVLQGLHWGFKYGIQQNCSKVAHGCTSEVARVGKRLYGVALRLNWGCTCDVHGCRMHTVVGSYTWFCYFTLADVCFLTYNIG